MEWISVCGMSNWNYNSGWGGVRNDGSNMFMCGGLCMEWISVCGMSRWNYNSGWGGVRSGSNMYMLYYRVHGVIM